MKRKSKNFTFVGDFMRGKAFWPHLGCTLMSVKSGKITVRDDITRQEVQFGLNWPPVRIYRALHNLRKGWIQR